MAGVDDIIAAWVRKAEQTGELRESRFWGKRLDPDDGFLETPESLRMAFKVLKNAGYIPSEVELLNTLAGLKERLKHAASDEDAAALRLEIAETGQKVDVMMGRLNRKR